MTIVAGVMTVGLLVVILRLIVTGRGLRTGFSLTRANPPVGKWSGEAVGRTLAVVSIITLLLTTSVLPRDVLARFAVPAILAVVVGAAVSLTITDRVLALVATGLTITELVHVHGLGAGVAVAVIALMAVWLMGLVRGFRP